MSHSVNPTNTQQEGDPLHILLANCLKTQNEKVIKVEQKLNEEEISYEDIIGFSEKDIRDTLGELQIKSLFIARIIKYLRTNVESSRLFHESKNTKVVRVPIYVSPEEQKSFDNLSKVYKHISNGTNNIQTSINNLELNRQNALKSIDSTFNILQKDLDKRKAELTKQTNDITKRKQNVLNDQLNKLTKYRNELESAKREYKSSWENEELNDQDRSSNNINNINKAINSQCKYDMIEPVISDKIMFECDDQYKILSNDIKQFGSIIGSMKPPIISVIDIKCDQCKVTVKAQTDRNVNKIKLEKYEIKYNMIVEDNDDEKKIDINDCKVLQLDGSKNDIMVDGLMPTTKYNFCARAYYEQVGFTNYSDIVGIKTQKKGRPLCWDRSRHGDGITFVNDQRIKYSNKAALCLADYTVKTGNSNDRSINVFEWTVKIHKYSNYSWIGFIDPKQMQQSYYGNHIAQERKFNCSFGSRINATSMNVYGKGKTQSSITTTALQIGDEFKFIADLNKKEVSLYHNNSLVGVLWKNIFDQFVPAASNNSAPAEYTIIGTVAN